MRVLTVVGTRPQFVKAFPVSRALRERHEEVLVKTGQHYDPELSAVFFDELGIPAPDHDLQVGSGPHAVQTARMLERLGRIVDGEAPDAVLVYGDTNSTLAAALAAAKLDPPLAHVEAGLRSFDREMPEEVNRVVADHVADLLFAPSEVAVDNLAAEGVETGVHRVGDVTYDALLWAREAAADRSTVIADLDLTPDEYVLATVHRAANTDDHGRLRAIVEGLATAPLPVVLPAHPRTTAALEAADLADRAREVLTLTEPQGYLDFVRLLDGAATVATDSGGVQKEAFFCRTPCVTLRDETEWVETVAAGWNRLVGADAAAIRMALADASAPDDHPTPYGDGAAAARIREVLERAVG
jgi:UDP-N-acetylglucosamine 2-epimerase (non-hydrolysing)